MFVKPKIHISGITFSDGQIITFNETDKIIIVGPNNSGKSQMLRDIIELASNPATECQVIHNLEVNKTGTIDDLKELLRSEGNYKNNEYTYGHQTYYDSWLNTWTQPNSLSNTAPIFMKNVTANDRLGICRQQNNISSTDPKTCPQHYLYQSSNLMSHVSALFKTAFNKDIIINYRGGNVIPIHVGHLPKDAPIDRVSDEYVSLVTKLPLLDKQGDGVKSYAGILFECVVQKLDVIMIDEPEAFLHPPQMRRLGETLSSEVEGQLFVATHSSDILKGFLEKTKGNIRILRIQREDNVNFVHEIDKKSVEQLWSKPILRYSNALDSLFHEQVIICEDGSDCRLFNFVADYLTTNCDKRYPDTCYVPTGGKHAIPGIAEALRASGVFVKAIFDFDLISELNTLTKTLDAFGCEGEEKNNLLSLWRKINSEVTQTVKPISNEDFKTNLLDFISKTQADKLSKGKVEEMFKQKKPWSAVKANGINGLPKGNIRKTFKEFNDLLKNLGIFLIPVGEIENFSAETGLHGPAFVEKFLDERNVSDSELESLREFVDEVYGTKIRPSLRVTSSVTP